MAESIALVLMDLHLLTPWLITVPSSLCLLQHNEKIQVEIYMPSRCLGGITAAIEGLSGDIWEIGAVLLIVYGIQLMIQLSL